MFETEKYRFAEKLKFCLTDMDGRNGQDGQDGHCGRDGYQYNVIGGMGISTTSSGGWVSVQRHRGDGDQYNVIGVDGYQYNVIGWMGISTISGSFHRRKTG